MRESACRSAQAWASSPVPAVTVLGAVAGALLAALAGAAAGCTVGAALGDFLDEKLLNNHLCMDCGHSFGSTPTRSNDAQPLHELIEAGQQFLDFGAVGFQ